MAQAVEKSGYITFDEYIAIEEQTGLRYDYQDGEIFARTGATRRHNNIAGNIYVHARQKLASNCHTYMEGVKVQLKANQSYRYPDVVISCDDREDHPLFIKHPWVIFEVLSDSTAELDRTDKFELYRKHLPTLQHYILVEQKRCFVQFFTRQNGFWQYESFSNMNDALDLTAVNVQLPLSVIYNRIIFDAPKKTSNTDL